MRRPSSDVWSRFEEIVEGRSPAAAFRLLVITAHPDDEILGAGILLARIPRSHVLCLTDGAPKDPCFRPPGAPPAVEDYARARREELRCAMELAGLERDRVRFGRVSDQEAIEHLPQLLRMVAEVVEEIAPDLVLTHAYEGGHPDHDAAAFCARRAGGGTTLGEMPYYHRAPGRPIMAEFLPAPPEVENRRLALTLSAAERALKKRMLRCFASQRQVLQAFGEPVRELFRPAPDYDFRRAPHPGPLHYEQAGFPMSGERWRELAEEVDCRSRY